MHDDGTATLHSYGTLIRSGAPVHDVERLSNEILDRYWQRAWR
jgi:hypothetical protein